MTRRDPLLRWSSPARPDKQAVELLSAGVDGPALELSMRRVASQLGNARFLVVNVESVDIGDLRTAIEAFLVAGGGARVCLAGDRKTLGRIDAAMFDGDHVGLMLDAVDADTPCADLVWDRIEAVRFRAAFVVGAASNVRLGCALESMLGLARDIGLCTLGANALPGGASLGGRADFDYLPVEEPLLGSAHEPQRLPNCTSQRIAATLSR